MRLDLSEEIFMDLISIIVPVYKVEKYIYQCVDSIINQTHKNIEIILVDDGSPDNCGKICDEYAEKDSRIKVIHKENGGLSDARNHGIDAASGEWLMFVDSDDYIALNMAEMLFKAATEYMADIVMCNFSRFKDDYPYDKTTEELPSPFLFEIAEKNNFLYISENSKLSVYHISAWGKIYRRSLFYELRYPQGRIYEDSTIAPTLLDSAHRIICLKESYYFYRTNPLSLTQQGFSIKHFDYLLLYKDRIDYFLKHGKTEHALRVSEEFFCFYFGNYFRIDCADKSAKRKLHKFRRLAWKVFPIYSKMKSVSLNQKISTLILLAFPSLFKIIFKR